MEVIEYEVGLIVPVPEVENLVGTYRAAYDPSAVKGVPAHITINYPFRSFQPGDSAILNNLRSLFQSFEAFEFQLVELCRFPNVLYLAPNPKQPFIDLASIIAEHFPESPPYEGKYDTLIPHLTIAEIEDAQLLEQLHREMDQKVLKSLPIKSRVNGVWLMDNRDGFWQRRTSFDLHKTIA